MQRIYNLKGQLHCAYGPALICAGHSAHTFNIWYLNGVCLKVTEFINKKQEIVMYVMLQGMFISVRK